MKHLARIKKPYAKTCSSCKKLFDAKDIRNNLCEKCLAVEVVKHWLKSDEVK
jgi:hypothetical protein|tara:strand:+ start:223 stop:378 length:156 start_codon:yes stop_codon:yes gene_type:complete